MPLTVTVNYYLKISGIEELNLIMLQIKEEVKTQPDRYSLIYVPNPLIVPGGRFREFYYW